MMRRIPPSFAFAFTLALAGCASSPAPVAETQAPARIEAPIAPKPAAKPPTAGEKLYTVKKGDTLLSIARDHGVDHRDLAAWNGIDDPARIKIGQSLRIAPPAAAPAMPAGAAEVHPIALGGPVASRSLDGTAPAQPAPPPVPAEADKFKRSPKGGKLPYSEANLARLKAEEGVPAQAAAAPAAAAEKPPVDKPAAPAPAAEGAGEIDWAWPAGGKLIGTFSEGGSGAEATKGIDIAGKIGDAVQAAAAGKVVYAGSGLRGYGNLVIVRHNAAFLSAYAHNSKIIVKEGQAVNRGQKIAELGNSDADQPKLHFEVRHQGRPVDPLKYLPAR